MNPSRFFSRVAGSDCSVEDFGAFGLSAPGNGIGAARCPRWLLGRDRGRFRIGRQRVYLPGNAGMENAGGRGAGQTDVRGLLPGRRQWVAVPRFWRMSPIPSG